MPGGVCLGNELSLRFMMHDDGRSGTLQSARAGTPLCGLPYARVWTLSGGNGL